MRMNILITGSNGFFGKNIIPTLERDYNILKFDSFKNFLSEPIKEEYLDLLNSAECVIHAAGLAHTNLNSKEHFEVNFEGTKKLVQSIKKNGNLRYFIFISSVSVYGLSTGTDISEKVLCKPVNNYAKSKFMTEEFLNKFFRESKVSCIILRLPLLIGSQPKGNLSLLYENIKRRRYFQIGNGKSRKSILIINDIATNFKKILSGKGTYNLTGEQDPTINDINKMIADATGGRFYQVPYGIAKFIFKIGDFLLLKTINLSIFQKLTSDLTFSNEKARIELKWTPSKLDSKFFNDF